jgi:8-oxo-dGTP pyrophosphatase MutT (NUDIX family)
VTNSPPPRFEGHEYGQVLPAIDEIRPGPPVPWATLPDHARRDLTLEKVVQRFRERGRHVESGPLPGVPDEVAAVEEARALPVTRRSAVLVALFEREGETHVVLSRRAAHLRHHRGEIAFPGGRSDEGEGPVQTAVREAHEEVGIVPVAVSPFGWLSPLATFASGSAIWPVVATLREPPDYRIDPAEVDQVFDVSLREMLDPGASRTERWRRATTRPGSDPEGFFGVTLYRVPGDLIWGATARILTELLCVASGVEWPDEAKVWRS